MPDLSSLIDPFKMGEDLPGQLEMVRRLAPQHCTSCGGFHLAWAERRAKTDHESELFLNPEFTNGILASIGRLHEAGHLAISIFIAGSADTKLLAACAYAVAIQKYFPRDAAEFHVMDACETPLQLSRSYAERFGLRIGTTAGDIPDAIPNVSANLLVVSGLLRFIPDERKALTMTRLRSLLSNGGAMAFTQSIRNNDDQNPSHFESNNPADLRNLIERSGFVIEREATTTISLSSGSEDRRKRTRYAVIAMAGRS